MSATHWQPSPINLPALTAASVHLWRANLDQLDFPVCLLSQDEVNRTERLKFNIHQKRFAAARNSLRCILARYLNRSPESLVFQYNAYGKPALPDHHFTTLGQRIYFNLSHSHQWAMYAIGLEEKIGVDVEYSHKELAVTDIAQRFFSATENQLLRQLPADNQLAAFFKLWTCKEAFIKALGHGLAFPLHEFDVNVLTDPPRLLAIQGDISAAQPWSLLQFNWSNEYTSALAIRSQVQETNLWQFG